MNISKKKCGVFIALCTLILTIGIFMVESDKVFADDKYVFLPLYDSDFTSNQVILDNGLNVFNNLHVLSLKPNKDIYVNGTLYNVSGYVKACGVYEGSARKMLYVSNVPNYVFTTNPPYGGIGIGYTNKTYNGLYYLYTTTLNTMYSFKIPSYNSLNEALVALDDGINAPVLPHEPEYNYNSDLGSLQNVYFRQVYDENNNSSQIEIIYDQYTSTGVNLNNNGYGVTTQIVRKDPVNNDVQISNTIAKLQEDSQKRRLLLLGLPLSGIRWSDISDTQHSTDYFFPDNSSTGSDNNNYNELVKYDILLRPYYFDGLDYHYGDTTVIENVDVNKIGTRMMKSFDETANNYPVDLNYTVVKNTDYKFTWNNNSISYNEYTNYNITNEDVVYNYTVNSDNSTEINNIGYSTTNIYNYDGDNPSFTFNDFNITQQDVINTVKSFKDVWSAIIYFVPHVLGLFAYLPTWSLVLVSGCFIILASVCVVKFVAPLL